MSQKPKSEDVLNQKSKRKEHKNKNSKSKLNELKSSSGLSSTVARKTSSELKIKSTTTSKQIREEITSHRVGEICQRNLKENVQNINLLSNDIVIPSNLIEPIFGGISHLKDVLQIIFSYCTSDELQSMMTCCTLFDHIIKMVDEKEKKRNWICYHTYHSDLIFESMKNRDINTLVICGIPQRLKKKKSESDTEMDKAKQLFENIPDNIKSLIFVNQVISDQIPFEVMKSNIKSLIFTHGSISFKKNISLSPCIHNWQHLQIFDLKDAEFDVTKTKNEVEQMNFFSKLNLSMFPRLRVLCTPKNIKALPISWLNPSLIHLDLSFMDIATLPEQITTLTELEHLNLSFCHKLSKNLPLQTGIFPNLRKFITVHDDQFLNTKQTIPVPVFLNHNVNLFTIKLSNCGLTRFPDIQLPYLRCLDLSYNRITQVPTFPKTFPRIQEIFLQCNQIKDHSIFKMLEQLTLPILALDLRGNTCFRRTIKKQGPFINISSSHEKKEVMKHIRNEIEKALNSFDDLSETDEEEMYNEEEEHSTNVPHDIKTVDPYPINYPDNLEHRDITQNSCDSGDYTHKITFILKKVYVEYLFQYRGKLYAGLWLETVQTNHHYNIPDSIQTVYCSIYYGPKRDNNFGNHIFIPVVNVKKFEPPKRRNLQNQALKIHYYSLQKSKTFWKIPDKNTFIPIK